MEIDDLLKKSFNSPSFEYKEEHWTAASSMIDSYYRVRLRNRIVTITLAFLVLIATVFLLYQLVLNNSGGSSKQLKTILSPIAGTENESRESPALEGQSESSIAAESGQVLTEAPESPTRSKENLSQGEFATTFNNSLSGNINNKKSQNHHYTTSNRETKDFIESSVVKDTGKEMVLLSEVSAGSVLTKSEEQLFSSEKLFELEPEMNQVFNLIKYQEDLTGFNTLPLPYNVVYDSQELSEDLQILGYASIDSQKHIRASWNKARYFAGAEIMTFPGMRQDASRFVGAGISGGINWFFHPNFFLDAGLGLSVRSGSFDPSIASTQYTQFFGPRFDSYVFRPKELLNASIPVSLGYELGRNQFLVGYRINYLIGVYGSMEYASHMNAPDQTGNEYNYEPVKNGWLGKDGFRNFMGGFLISYRYEFSSRIFGGIRFHYLPNDWIAKDFGQVYDFNSMRYVSPDIPVNGLREKNWILGFNMIYIL